MPEREPIPVQGTFEGLPVQRVIRLAARASLSRLLQPEQWSLDQESFEGLTPMAIEAAAPQQLAGGLVDVRARSEGAVSYPDAVLQRDVWVSLSPQEYALVSKSPLRQAHQAEQRSLARSGINMFLPESRSRSSRAGAHTLESNLEQAGSYVQGVLEPRAILLARFVTAAEHPGLSQFGKESGFRMRMAEYQGAVDDMLRALGVHREWTQEQFELARKATQWRIVMDRTSNRHIENFRDLTRLLAAHNAAKLAVFRSKAFESRRLINQRQVP